ncbi:MAG: hypothetical protein QOD94_2664 [Alphaproteobacteria bacterium]|nr:hypothetical protein [Alphaproteobacteria bacterium]
MATALKCEGVAKANRHFVREASKAAAKNGMR